MQAIATKYIGPTNHHGSRISVSADAGRRIYSWDPALNVEENHTAAAERFARELKWIGGNSLGLEGRFKLVGGALPKGASHAYAFVLVKVGG